MLLAIPGFPARQSRHKTPYNSPFPLSHFVGTISIMFYFDKCIAPDEYKTPYYFLTK
jgi:hypothetical protein